MIQGPTIFYLRDEPAFPDPKRLFQRASRPCPRPPKQQTKYRGQPLVCIAVGRPSPDLISFAVATANPADFDPDYGPTQVVFSKERAREIALGRLIKQKTTTSRTVHSSWPDRPAREFSTQVGAVIPLPLETAGAALQRAIVSYIVDPANGFAPTAQKLARRWLSAAHLADIDRRSTRIDQDQPVQS